MNDTKRLLLQKIKALADRGVGGESSNAEAMLLKLMQKYGLSQDDLEESKRVRTNFHYSKPFEDRLLCQVIYMVLGDVPVYRYTNSRAKVYRVDCTAAERIEIQAAFDFYRHHLAEGLAKYYRAFVQKEDIFYPEPSENVPTHEMDEEEIFIASAITKHNRYKAIEAGEESAQCPT